MFTKKRKAEMKEIRELGEVLMRQSMVPEEFFTEEGLRENRLLPYQNLKLIRIFRNKTPDDIDGKEVGEYC